MLTGVVDVPVGSRFPFPFPEKEENQKRVTRVVAGEEAAAADNGVRLSEEFCLTEFVA